MDSVFLQLRKQLHKRLCDELITLRTVPDGRQVYNMCDFHNGASVDLAAGMVEGMQFPCGAGPGRTEPGALFTRIVREYIETAFNHLNHLRPGPWQFPRNEVEIAHFEQYEHLRQLGVLLQQYPEVKTAFAGDYIIKPDIVVARTRLPDAAINAPELLVGDGSAATMTSLREAVKGHGAILHASISCKWTMRSDRSQNVRTEALNLVRNRKGKVPHIVAVTMEPLPSRLASIAMGTGDLDCTYHVALHELLAAAKNSRHEDSQELLATLVEGDRLRDVSDLPMDLAV